MIFQRQYIIQTDDKFYKENKDEAEAYHKLQSSRDLAHEIDKYYPATVKEYREPNEQVWEQRLVILTPEQYWRICDLAVRMEDKRLSDLLKQIDQEEKENTL